MRRRRSRFGRDDYEGREDRPRIDHLEDDLDRLKTALAPYSITINEVARERLLRFSKELIAWNDRLNLLSRADAPNVIRKHVAASSAVFLVAHPSRAEKWIDVGTGAGFPGLVLKILRPEIDITLLDSARKRCLFVESVLRSFELGRVPVLPLRVETMIARGEGIGAYTVLTARAVSSLGETVASFGPLVAPGGRIVTFKGPQWEEELQQVQTTGGMEAAGFSFEAATRIPWTAGHLLTLRKNGSA